MEEQKVSVPSIIQNFDLPDFIVMLISLAIWGILALMKVKPLEVPTNFPVYTYHEKSTIPTVTLGVIVGVVGLIIILGGFFLRNKLPHIIRDFQIFTC